MGAVFMKFLVLGAGGMAGHMIATYLVEQDHEVLGFDREKVRYCPSLAGDARDLESVRELVRNGNFDSVINCIGILNQFAEEEKELAVFLNSYFPHFLAKVTKDSDTQVIQMSTDCVFSGEKGGYTETDLRDGATFYDRTKALGELEDAKNITLRNSIVGPDPNEKGIGLFNWFMRQKETVAGYTRALWTGVTTLQLAKAMEYAATVKAAGLYHLVYREPINKYNLLRLFNKWLRHEALTVRPSDAVVADKSLRRTRFEFDYVIPDYETMIAEMADWIQKHPSYYPHYWD
jgi:dTDP-4-dehydrorhamnose reductase